MVWPAVIAAGASAAGSMYSANQNAAAQAAANEYNVNIERARMAAAGSQKKYAAEVFQPYTEAGSEAVTQQQALMGLSGEEARQEAYQKFLDSPGQRFLREQARKEVLRNMAAQSSARGGRALAALQDRAMLDYGSYYDRLSGLRDTGAQSANTLATTYTGEADIVTPEKEKSGIARMTEGFAKSDPISSITKGTGLQNVAPSTMVANVAGGK
jgi:hypothetical protein